MQSTEQEIRQFIIDNFLYGQDTGELRSDATFGGSAQGCWLRVPGAGKYYLVLTASVFERVVPPPAGRFDGHVLAFQAERTTVRIESDGTFGDGMELPVYFVGLRADR